MARDSPWIDKPGLFIQGCPVGLSIVLPVRETEIGGLDLDLAANGSRFAANRLDPRMASVFPVGFPLKHQKGWNHTGAGDC